MGLFLFLSCISLGQYCWKSLAKSKGFGKNINREDSHIKRFLKKGVQTFCIMIFGERLKGWTMDP